MKVVRDEAIDRAKGMLIYLVVLGHVVGLLCHYSTGSTQQLMMSAYKAIYLFHMPAFFFLVGWIESLKAQNGEGLKIWEFVGKKAYRLLVPYAFWGVASALIFWVFSGLAHGVWQGTTTGYYGKRMFALDWWQPLVSLLHAGGWPHGEGFRCNGVLWFLPCMFVVVVAYEGIGRMLGKSGMNWLGRGWLVVLAMVCFGLGGVMRFYGPCWLPLGIDRAPYYLGFVALGEYLGRIGGVGLGRNVMGLVFGWVGFLIIVAFYPDLSVAYYRWSWYLASIGMALFGSVLTLGTMHFCSGARAFSIFGGCSMGIMLSHKFLILPIQMMIGKLLAAFPSIAANDGRMVCLIWLGVALLISWAIASVAYWFTLFLRRIAPLVLGETRK